MCGDRLLVAAGGTGGHIYPAIAVAERFKELAEDPEVTFVGTDRGLESRIVPRAGFPLELVRAVPLRGGSLLRKLKGIWGLFQGMLDARKLLAKVRPSVVMGVGAYVSGTVLLSAALRGIPTLILEPNAEPGLANKWLGPFVDEAACAWEQTARTFGAKGFVTGNPVRRSVVDVPPLDEQGGTMRVLLFGGSQGSKQLNDAMLAAAPILADASDRIVLVHQTGPKELERVRETYASHGTNARAVAYIDDMDEAYRDADLVVARAGATTCAELAACGRPAVLVPLELAGGHQRSNAEMMARAGAAVWIASRDVSGESLANELRRLLDAPETRTDMAARARELARLDAATAVAERLIGLSRKHEVAA